MDKIEEKLWANVRKRGWLFQAVPFLRFVAVCNNLSFGVVTEKSDVDVFIVAKKNRVYTVWFFANFFTRLFGARTYEKNTAGKFCLSFLVDEGALGFARMAVKNDVYLANWLFFLLPLIDRGCGANIEAKNKWILPIVNGASNKSEFVLNRSFLLKKSVGAFVLSKFFEILMFGPIGNLFEKLFRFISLRRLGNKKGAILLKGFIKLHENDRRVTFRELYLKSGKDNFVAFLRTLPKN